MQRARALAGDWPILRSTFVVARRYEDGPRVFARAAEAGTYDLLVSIGLRDGTPKIGLPLPDGDGHRRYRLGPVELLEAAAKP